MKWLLVGLVAVWVAQYVALRVLLWWNGRPRHPAGTFYVGLYTSAPPPADRPLGKGRVVRLVDSGAVQPPKRAR